jgi:DNA-binding phage protein
VPKRSKNWNEGLAQDLRNTKFVKEFLLAALDEGVSIQVVLGKIIRAYGVKEFAEKIHMASPNVLRAINPRHNPTLETLNTMLRPFNLKISVTPIQRIIKRSA